MGWDRWDRHIPYFHFLMLAALRMAYARFLKKYVLRIGTFGCVVVVVAVVAVTELAAVAMLVGAQVCEG